MTARADTRVSAYEGESGIVGSGTDAAALRVDALDGIRAIAIILVLIHNVGSVEGSADGIGLKLWALLSNAGWIGVQLFFALSGFLITRILLGSVGARGWAKSFYARRVLRIVPLYFVVLAIVFFVAPHVGALHAIATPPERSTGWYWLYLSNWVGPFGGMAPALPHVWSLAVEEQFYLVWPLLVAALSDRMLAVTSVILVVTALAMRVVLHRIYPYEIASAAAYTWTITRSDAIALGAVVAIALRYRGPTRMLRERALLALGVTMLGLALATVLGRGLSSQGPFSELMAQPLTGILGALLVAICVVPGAAERGVNRGLVAVFASRPMRTIGKYSYALYVFHMPIRLLLRPAFGDRLTAGGGSERLAMHVAFTVAVFALSMVAALMSWNLLEAPLLGLKRYVPMPAGGKAGPPPFAARKASG